MQWQVRRPERLIDFLKSQMPGSVSAKSIRRSLELNACKVNGRIERFASTALSAGDRVTFLPKAEEKREPLSVLFEDEWIKVVNKPPGLVCEDAVFRRLLGSCHFLIHRLDKDTSGLLLIAKNLEVKNQFIELFEKREVFKLYLALADGVYPKEKATQESWLVRQKSFAGQTIWGSLAAQKKSPFALYARTEIKTMARGKQATLFSCQPVTGRTHQIRVHLSELGHPILTDRQYAERFRSSHTFARPLLHASSLSFIHPFTKEPIDLSVPLPRDMQSAIELVGIFSRNVGELFVKQNQKERGDESDQDKETKEVG